MKQTRPKTRYRGSRTLAMGFAVAAVALIAVLTLLLCFLGGVFDFSGRSTAKMPELRGQTEANARQALSALDMNIQVRVTTTAGEEDAGVVLAQSVAPGASLKKNQTVRLTVSDGSLAKPVRNDDPEPDTEALRAPNVVGQELAAARESAERMGIYLTDGGAVYSSQPAGVILAQDPAAGTPVPRGSAVRVTVSLGPETPEYVISARCSAGGSVSPEGETRVKEGERAEFVLTPEEGYVLQILELDGQEVTPQTHVVFEDVSENHTLYAVFEPAPEGGDGPEGPDVPDGPAIPASPTDL